MENSFLDFDKAHFHAEPAFHRGKNIIWIHFPKNFKLVDVLKKQTIPKWSKTKQCWYISDNTFNRQLFGLELKVIGKDALQKIEPINQPALQNLIDHMKLKGLSPNTIKTYTLEFAQLLYIIRDFPIDQLTPERLKSYFLYCINQLEISENHLHSRINAIKFYFEKVQHQPKMFFDIPRPKKPLLLPKALNTNEIKKLINTTENPKHQLILKLVYGMGLRVSEIVNLKIQHMDSQAMRVLIQSGIGKKDRYVNLPESILQELRIYYKTALPKDYLFEGQYGGQYSIRSVQAVFKNAMKKCGIHKNVGIHSLRHSYATHLIEQGTDIRFVQDLLGHSNIKTTMLYTSLTDQKKRMIRSPLDNL